MKDIAVEATPGRLTIVIGFISIGLVFCTMIVGVYFSGTEAGVECDDWPLCPNGLFALPEERYAVEYMHRLLAAVTACFVYATAVVIPYRLRMAKKAAVLAAVIVSVQLALGYLTVITNLHPLVVATHLSTGITTFAFTLLAFMWARMWREHLKAG